MIFDICLLCLSLSLLRLQLLLVLVLPVCLILSALVLTKACLCIVVFLLSPCRIFLSCLCCSSPAAIIVVGGSWRSARGALSIQSDVLSFGCRYILIVGWTSPLAWFAIKYWNYAEVNVDPFVFAVFHRYIVDKSPTNYLFICSFVNINISDINQWCPPLPLISFIKCLKQLLFGPSICRGTILGIGNTVQVVWIDFIDPLLKLLWWFSTVSLQELSDSMAVLRILTAFSPEFVRVVSHKRLILINIIFIINIYNYQICCQFSQLIITVSSSDKSI